MEGRGFMNNVNITIDIREILGDMVAKSDNCEGKKDLNGD